MILWYSLIYINLKKKVEFNHQSNPVALDPTRREGGGAEPIFAHGPKDKNTLCKKNFPKPLIGVCWLRGGGW